MFNVVFDNDSMELELAGAHTPRADSAYWDFPSTLVILNVTGRGTFNSLYGEMYCNVLI